MTEMSKTELVRFLMHGTFTGKLATVKEDGGSHVVPISFVTIFGTAKIYPYKQKEVLKWATKIAERYMGKSNAETYGRRNSEEGLVLVHIKPTRIIAEKDIAGWD